MRIASFCQIYFELGELLGRGIADFVQVWRRRHLQAEIRACSRSAKPCRTGRLAPYIPPPAPTMWDAKMEEQLRTVDANFLNMIKEAEDDESKVEGVVTPFVAPVVEESPQLGVCTNTGSTERRRTCTNRDSIIRIIVSSSSRRSYS